MAGRCRASVLCIAAVALVATSASAAQTHKYKADNTEVLDVRARGCPFNAPLS